MAAGDKFTHGVYAPDRLFTSPELCPECKRSWDEAADEINAKERFSLAVVGVSPRQYAYYNSRLGPMLSPSKGMRYEWETREEVEGQRKLYEDALKVPLEVVSSKDI